jgi:hypothetical protein
MRCNITLEENGNSVSFQGEITFPKLLAALNAASQLFDEEKTVVEVIPEVKEIIIPETLEESIKYAKKLGYKNIDKNNFNSAHKVTNEMPRFVKSLGLPGFITWYRNIEKEKKPARRVKDVSLHRYFDAAKNV